jgi:hypothetical protein
VTKSSDSNDDTYEVTFNGSLAGIRVATMIVRLYSTKPIIRTTQAGATTGTPANEIQTIDIGTPIVGNSYTMELTLGAETTAAVPYGDITAQVLQNMLQSMTGVETVTVTLFGSVYTVEFTGVDGSANQSQLVASTTDAALFVLPVTLTDGIESASEVQLIALVGQPTGGTFTLTFQAEETSNIAYNASESTVESALEALSTIGSGNVTVTGGAGGPWTVTFAGAEANTDQLSITGDGSSLTGGSGQAVSSSTATASSGPNHWDVAANWIPSGVPASGDDVVFTDSGADCLYGMSQASVTLDSLTIGMEWANRRLGLSRTNDNGYLEYRETQLTIGADIVTIGTGEGDGPSRVFLDTGTVQTALTLENSGAGNGRLPAVVWIGNNVANTITINGGDFGTAPYPDQSATLDTLVMNGGRCVLRNTEISTSFAANGNPLSAHDCTLGGLSFEI